MKTQQEIEELKRQWLTDPCWDIYNTEGFAEYKEELAKFQAEKEKEWKEQYQNGVKEKAELLGIADNMKLAEYIVGLEARITEIEALVER